MYFAVPFGLVPVTIRRVDRMLMVGANGGVLVETSKAVLWRGVGSGNWSSMSVVGVTSLPVFTPCSG
jgi:hypothetical protein